MAKKKPHKKAAKRRAPKKRTASRTNPPKGWVKATAVKITRRGGKVHVMVKKAGRRK